MDRESGLWYFRARYYSGTLGRFIGRDPLGYVDGRSMYRAYFVPNELDETGMKRKPLDRPAPTHRFLGTPCAAVGFGFVIRTDIEFAFGSCACTLCEGQPYVEIPWLTMYKTTWTVACAFAVRIIPNNPIFRPIFKQLTWTLFKEGPEQSFPIDCPGKCSPLWDDAK